MSKIEVDTIAPQSGTTVTLGESGDTITVPSGATLDTSNSTVTLPDDSVTTAKINNEAVTPAKLGYNYNQFRNIIINGDMSIAQRGTSATGIGNGDTGYHTLDRWKFFENDSPSYEFTMSQSTDVPSGYGFATSLKMDCTTAEAGLAAADLAYLEHYIEGQNVQYLKKGTANAEYVTASFWVKSTKTGTFIVELVDVDNSRFTNFNYTVNVSDTWEKKTITFVPDTTGTLDNDNAVSFWMFFWLGAGTDKTSGTLNTSWNSDTQANRVSSSQVNLADNTANEFFITGVQLEAGTTASDFEFSPVDVNLARCQRYFENLLFRQTVANNYTTTAAYGELKFTTTKRASPSITVLGTTTYATGGVVKTGVTLSSSNMNIKSMGFQVTTTGLTVGNAGHIDNTNPRNLTVDAEL